MHVECCAMRMRRGVGVRSKRRPRARFFFPREKEAVKTATVECKVGYNCTIECKVGIRNIITPFTVRTTICHSRRHASIPLSHDVQDANRCYRRPQAQHNARGRRRLMHHRLEPRPAQPPNCKILLRHHARCPRSTTMKMMNCRGAVATLSCAKSAQSLKCPHPRRVDACLAPETRDFELVASNVSTAARLPARSCWRYHAVCLYGKWLVVRSVHMRVPLLATVV